MANMRDATKRLKGFGIPIEVCVKYERRVGVKTGEEPTKQQRDAVTALMVSALTTFVNDVTLTSDDYIEIAREVAANEAR